MAEIKKEFQKGLLNVKVYDNKEDMGEGAASFVSEELQKAIHERGKANLILATGASQFSFLDALKKHKEIEWSKVTAFHQDEYVGISEEHPASFRKYLKDRILNFVHPAKQYLIEGDAKDLKEMMRKYEELLKANPVDVICLGIGENGHIAFNDPAVADFNDSYWVKVVKLDNKCRNQQVGEGWFKTMDEVPEEAVSLTIPGIMNCKAISCVVPDSRKATAVRDAIYGEISTKCPASILREHPNVKLFLDSLSASKISE